MKQEKLEKEIARRNEIWQNATKPERAVLIAQDVLDRLKTKQIEPSTGVWADFNLENEKGALQCEILNGSPCECCAMGGLMISTIAFRNKVKIEDLSFGALDWADPKFNLSESFSPTQLKIIELAFEGGSGNFEFEFDLNIKGLGIYRESLFLDEEVDIISDNVKTKRDKQNLNIIKFFRKYPKATNRMKAIMENIIENKGIFIP